MTQNVFVGAADNPLGPEVYSNQSMIDAEEVAVGSNGFGVRMTACRIYHNYFTQGMTSGGLDERRLKSGHVPIVSFTHPAKAKSGFTWHGLATTTTYDSDLDAYLTRVAAEPFDAAVSGGSTYGGLNAAFQYLCLGHEIDRETPHPGLELYPGDTANDFILSWQKAWNHWQTIAAANGVSPSRIRWTWIITVSNLSTADQFYPGDKYVDVIGFDPYTGPTNPASFAALCSAAFTYARNKKKPIGFGEINIRHTADSTSLQQWFIDAATTINALDISVEYWCLWPAGSNVGQGTSTYYQYNINKVADTNGHAFPDGHAGFLSMINALGGNAIRTSVAQALPGSPTGLGGTSSSDGTQETVTWAANAGGDNVTAWKVLRADGWVTSGGAVVGSVNTATPRSFTDTGRTPGAKYTYWVAAVNAATTGTPAYGPLSAPLQVQTTNPGSGSAPVIVSSSAVPETANPQNVDFAAAATSPLGRSLTYSWQVFNGQGIVIDSFSGTSVTRTYQTSGAYTWTLTVTDTGSLSHSADGSFQLVFGSSITPMNGWNMANFQPGVFVELIGQGLIPIFTDLDSKVGNLLATVGEAGELWGSVGQTFDPSVGSTSNTANLAAGTIIWTKLKCRSSTISSIDTITTQAQIGTGSKVAICDNTYVPVTLDGTPATGPAIFSGTNVDAWLTHAAGDTTYQLDTAVSGLTQGQDITIVVFSPPSGVTQYAHFVGAPGPNGAATVNGNSATPVFGSASGQTDITVPLPVGSYAGCPRPLFIINA